MDVRTGTERWFVLELSEEEMQVIAKALGSFRDGLTGSLYAALVEEGVESWEAPLEIVVEHGPYSFERKIVRREDEDN